MWPPAASCDVLAVLGEHDAEPGGVLEGTAHQPAVLHAPAVVGEQAHAELGQLGHRDEALAPPSDRDGARPRRSRPRPFPRGRARRGRPQPSRWQARCSAWRRPRCSRRGRRPSSRTRPSRRSRRPVRADGRAGRPGRARRHSRRRRARWHLWGHRSIVSSTRPTIRPSLTRTSPRRSPVSSTSVPPRTTISPQLCWMSSGPWSSDLPRSEQVEKDGHAHEDAVSHLARHQRRGQVGHIRARSRRPGSSARDASRGRLF